MLGLDRPATAPGSAVAAASHPTSSHHHRNCDTAPKAAFVSLYLPEICLVTSQTSKLLLTTAQRMEESQREEGEGASVSQGGPCKSSGGWTYSNFS